MNTIEVNQYLRRYKDFKGTYPRDLLPNYLKSGEGIVINTDKSDRPGEHWVAVYKNNNTAEYFDSFGLPPMHKEIINFLDIISPIGWSYNNITFQSIHTRTCGMYCVYYLANRFNGGDFEMFYSIFNNRPNINDRLAEILYKISK